MRRLPGVAVAAALFVVPGCAGSSDGEPTPTHSTPVQTSPDITTPDTAASTTPDDGELSQALQDDLAPRLVTSAEYLGMRRAGPIRFLTTQELAASDPDPNAAQQYDDEQAQGVVSVHLLSPRSSDAICTVLRFAKPSGAQQNLATAADIAGADKVKTFDVPGIPSAIGTDVILDGKVVGRNVVFTSGPYEYIIGFQPDPASDQTYSQQEMAAAAQNWYARVSAL
jgi:hypothetical protein